MSFNCYRIDTEPLPLAGRDIEHLCELYFSCNFIVTICVTTWEIRVDLYIDGCRADVSLEADWPFRIAGVCLHLGLCDQQTLRDYIKLRVLSSLRTTSWDYYL